MKKREVNEELHRYPELRRYRIEHWDGEWCVYDERSGRTYGPYLDLEEARAVLIVVCGALQRREGDYLTDRDAAVDRALRNLESG